MQRAFILLWTATAIVIIALMVLLYVSLIPHFRDIGDWFVWVLRLGMVCGAVLMLVGTYCLLRIMLSKQRRVWVARNVIAEGEVVAYLAPDGTWTHLSHIHETGKVQQMKALPEPSPSWQAVLDLRRDGKGMHQIAKELKVPYNKVRDFLNSVEKDESTT